MDDPFNPKDLTVRERWAKLKARIHIRLCGRGYPCPACPACPACSPPRRRNNTITYNGPTGQVRAVVRDELAEFVALYSQLLSATLLTDASGMAVAADALAEHLAALVI